MKPSIQTGLLRLRHLREVTEAKAEEMDEERARFDALRDREPVRAISSFNLFQTPPEIASQMAAKLGNVDGLRVLEPSAGLGRLVRAVGVRGPEWVLVEQNTDCCAELYRFGLRLVQADFLGCDADRLGGLFDCVVMNPPFKLGRDIKHIAHAKTLLKPGGLLVALCFDGVRQNAKLRPVVDSWEVLPADSFASEGTKAGVAMVTYRKPD